jgi:hypothetical protein
VPVVTAHSRFLILRCRFFFSLWAHSLLIPSYFALASISLLILHVALSSGPLKRLRARIFGSVEDESSSLEYTRASNTRTGLVSAVKDHVGISGGPIIFSLQVLRLILVLTLLSLSIFSFVQEEEQRIFGFDLGALGKRQGRKGKQKHRYGGPLSDREWLDLASSLTYVGSQQDFLIT